MVGIYKITSPINSVYIGQSRRFLWRIKWHRSSVAKKGKNSKIVNSLREYGFKSHVFELIHELPKDVSTDVMDNYEQFYMDAYIEAGISILNCKYAGNNGKVFDEETKRRRSEAFKKRPNPQPKGFKHSQETKDKLAAMFTGKPSKNKGRIPSAETRQKMSISRLGKTGAQCPNSKKVICSVSGNIYSSGKEAAELLGLNKSTLMAYLSGRLPNKTTLIYYTDGG